MKKHLLSVLLSTCMLFVGNNMATSQNIISSWDGDGVIGANSKPNDVSWDNTDADIIPWEVANGNGGCRFRDYDVTGGHTGYTNEVDGSTSTTRQLMLRYDHDTYMNSVYSYPVTLEPCTFYTFSFDFLIGGSGTAPQNLKAGISTTKDETGHIASQTFTTTNNTTVYRRGELSFTTDQTGGLYYITFSGARVWYGITNLSIEANTEESLSVSVAEIEFSASTKTSSFVVTGNSLQNNISLTAPDGVVLDVTSISAADAQCGVTVTATYEGSSDVIDQDIVITSGSLSKSIFVTYDYLAPNVETVVQLVDEDRVLTDNTELHITSEDAPFVNSTVSLDHEDAWLFFDNIKPSVVANNYLGSVLVNGSPFVNGTNGRIAIYAHGAVLMPHSSVFKPLTVYTGEEFTGESNQYSIHTYHNILGDFDNAIKSFKLKRGYQATFANNADGSGYSRVFIAHEQDLEIDMPQELSGSVSFIRVFKHQWVTKKGKAGWNPNEINGTAYYDWNIGGSSSLDYEYAAIRQNGGWPGWDAINNKQDITHLLGYNEPDQSDQSNMTYTDMINIWPGMYGSGLRVGSPAYANAWSGNTGKNLFDFVAACEDLNYRTDFIAVHSYWENSASSWYSSLKDYHERCGGRPIWITEMNNGANWTSEWWPDNDTRLATTNNVNRQLNNMKEILHMLDTTSFVERYYLYDWVQDCRAMVVTINDTYLGWVESGDQRGDWIADAPVLYQNGDGYDVVLTPFGEYYRDHNAPIAYNGKYEIVPVWNYVSPSLDSRHLSLSNSMRLDWDDPNGELSKAYKVEKKVNDGAYEEIYYSEDVSVTYFIDPVNPDNRGKVTYKVSLLKSDGAFLSSNEVVYFQSGGTESLQIGQMKLNNSDWTTCYFSERFSTTPHVIMGATSYNNVLPMTQRVNSVSTSSFKFHFEPWSYLTTGISKSDDVALLAIEEGTYDFGGLKGEVAQVTGVRRDWVSIEFTQAFDVVPVVFCTQVSNGTIFPTTVGIQNVTTTGFEVCLLSEESITSTPFGEKIDFLAIEPGEGAIGEKRVTVGATAEGSGIVTTPVSVEYDETYEEPVVFTTLLSVNNSFASTVRYTADDVANEFKLSRVREMSAGLSSTTQDQLGWMIMDQSDNQPTGINTGAIKNVNIYPNPIQDILYFDLEKEELIEVMNISGQTIMQVKAMRSVNLSHLGRGVYLIKIGDSTPIKIVKE
ncbi:glycosyl hydrolase [Carboxylicivirga linearis]|uniref:T9SS type A sorting domain-containing protein n=1 Tax=Carboxylicivirga linearis TaxID=1628157 RepID=A0ABS5JXI8_9BACT|nr:glycosyl hydrolase [Carboxylicivirga linearis]MBS2099621.1 T9SS type A sorting domain-containing protein [Carboxylicivirga linearis]